MDLSAPPLDEAEGGYQPVVTRLTKRQATSPRSPGEGGQKVPRLTEPPEGSQEGGHYVVYVKG